MFDGLRSSHMNFQDFYIPGPHLCFVFGGLDPQKQGLVYSKQGSFGFQVYIYKYKVYTPVLKGVKAQYSTGITCENLILLSGTPEKSATNSLSSR